MREQCRHDNEFVGRLAAFLADYSAHLWQCGATCLRIDKNVTRIARRFGLDACVSIFPRHTTVALTGADDNRLYAGHTAKISEGGAPNFLTNSQLSHLSWDLAEKRVAFDNAYNVMHRILREPRLGQWKVIWLVVLANASFCRLFAGDLAAMLIVALATFAGYALKIGFLKWKIDSRVMVICASYISALIGSSGFVIGVTETPDIALGTSVLYLIPGIPYINSVSDLLDGHYLCSISRGMQAMITTVCIAAGLTLGYLTMHLTIF